MGVAPTFYSTYFLKTALVVSTEAKTDCQEWGTDSWQGYERVVPTEVDHYISKALTQRLELPTLFYGSKVGAGIDDKTNLASCGNRPR